MTRTEFFDRISRELDLMGVAHRFDMQRRTHPRLYFETDDGAERFYVLPGSVSDRRALPNAIADLRRIRIKAEPRITALSLTPGPDWKSPLAECRKRAVIEQRGRATYGPLWPTVRLAIGHIRDRADEAVANLRAVA